MANPKKLKPRRRNQPQGSAPTSSGSQRRYQATDETEPMFHWWATWPVAYVLLIIIGCLTYSNSIDGRLFFDDLSSIGGNPNLQVLANPKVRKAVFHGLGEALGLEDAAGESTAEDAGTWRRIMGDALTRPKDSFDLRRQRGTLGLVDLVWSPQDNPFAGRPIVQLSFNLNHWVATVRHPSHLKDDYGVNDLHIKYFHFVNLTLHIIVGLVLWSLTRRIFWAPVFGDRFKTTAPYWAAAISMLWLVHPINTETVVYVTQRTELILALFFLLTFYGAARSAVAETTESSVFWQLFTVGVCALGMASKENMAAAPLLLILFDRAFFYRTWKEISFAAFGAGTTLLFIGIAWWAMPYGLGYALAGAAVVTIPLAFLGYRFWPYEQRTRGWLYVGIFATYAIFLFLFLQNPRGESVGFHHERMLWFEYLITQCWCLWRYMWLSLLPIHSMLCVDYGRRVVYDFAYTAPGALMVAAILAATIWGFFKKPWVAFLGCWYFFILAPTSSFFPIVTEVGAERRMYLPLIVIMAAVCIAVVEGFKFATHIGTTDRRLPNWAPTAAGVGVALAIMSFGLISHARNIDYKTDKDLYGHIVQVFPENDRGSNNFAKICVDMGEHSRALELLNKAIFIDPEYSDAYTNRGIIYHHQRRYDVAIQNATEALRWNPKNISAWNNRGNAFMEIREFDRSLADFTEVIRLNPFDSNGYFGRANVRFTQGNFIDETWLREHPGQNLPNPSPGRQSYDYALIDCNSALEKNPNDYKVYNTKGNALKKMGRPLEALETFNLAIEMIRKQALSVQLPIWDSIELAMKLDLRGHNDVMRFSERQTLAAIFGNRADAYRMLFDARQVPNADQHMLQDLTRAIIFDPNNMEYFRVRGSIQLQFQRFKEAFSDLTVVLNFPSQQLDMRQIEARRARIHAAIGMREFKAAWEDAKFLRNANFALSQQELEELSRLSGQAPYPQ